MIEARRDGYYVVKSFRPGFDNMPVKRRARWPWFVLAAAAVSIGVGLRLF